MKKDIIKILFGVVVGFFLATLFRCEGKGCPDVETKIEWEVKEVKVPVENIKYLKGDSYPVYVYLDGDTVILYDTVPGDIPVIVATNYTKPFSYKDTSIEITGEANIVAKDLFDFKFNMLDIKYNEKTITKTIEAKRRMNLLVGTNAMFTPTSFNGVNFNVGLKTRKDFVFEVGYNARFNGADSYEAGIKIPVFHRKK